MNAVELIGFYVLVIFLIAIIGDRVWTVGQMKYFKMDIKTTYGTMEHYKKKKGIKREEIESYFRNIKDEEDFVIDNITWHDLNMDEIFKMLSNVQSSVGREVLYKLLRVPLFSKEELDNRDNIIKFLRENRARRFNIQYLIRSIVGKKDDAKISNYFMEKKKKKKNGPLTMHLILRYMIIVVFIAALITRIPILFMYFIFLAIINGAITALAKKDKIFALEDAAYLISTIRCAFKIRKLNVEEINKAYPHIDEDLKLFRNIRPNPVNELVSSTGGSNGIVKAILDSILFLDLVDFERVSNVIFDNPEAVRRIYEYVGELDALTGVASFRETLDFFAKPEFTKAQGIEFEGIYNPILSKPVLNSFKEDKSILLTGSNASGKSTFLRTVGVNIILSQTFNMVCAKSYNAPMYRIFSSMALSDNILGGESYYMVEIKSLKRILNNIDKNDYPVFCIVDEILRGTNTAERIAASSEILKYIVNSNEAYALAATHDIELTYMLEDIFNNYSFEEKVKNKDIVFDYKIKEGRAKTRNAIKILEFIGYDKKIVKEAEKKAEEFINNNKWGKEKA